MRLAWFSPLPPIPSGIADYSSEIVPYVAQRAEVDVFCPRPGVFSRARVPRGATLRDPKDYPRLLDRYDAAFYHLGNNPYHEFVYKTAKDRPGIAVFHDAGFPILIAVAMVLGSATRSPRTMGAAPSAWKPSILGSARAGPAAAAEAPPRA